MQNVVHFKDARGADKFLLGGKGYGLAEMTALGLPVPPGFTITTQVCKEYYANGGKVPDGLFEQVRAKITDVEKQTGKRFGGEERPLLFSVRSGAPFSMPGMMDTILNLGLNDITARRVAEITRNERFAYDSYRRLIQMFGKIAMGADAEEFEKVLDARKKAAGAKMDIDLSPQELRGVTEEFKRIVKERTGKEFPQDPFVQLEMAVVAVLRSWDNQRAKEYRKFYNIPDDLGTAVNIQTMVFGNFGDNSGSGVGFTRNPSTGEKKLFGEYLPNSQGEDVVAGIRTPVSIDGMHPALRAQLQDVAERLEAHFKDMQDFEFTVEDNKLYTLQTRNGKRTAQAAVKIAVDMAKEGLITTAESVARVEPDQLEALLHRRLDPRSTDKPVAKGLDASPGAASGKVVFDTEEAASTGGSQKIILVRPETTPEDIKGLIASQGVLTVRGGMTSHAAVVARGMGKPAVVGCSEIEISMEGGFFTTKLGEKITKGETITIDGTTGSVYKGVVRTVDPDPTPELSALLEFADRIKRLGVWANADTPEAAAKAREFGAEGIGLCRTERMFNDPKRLPIVREMIMSLDAETRKKHLYRLFPFQLSDFKGIFAAMGGKPVVVRLLDLPLHEFLPSVEELLIEIQGLKEKGVPDEELEKAETMLNRVRQLSEHNPMIGHRGCRLAITHPEIYEMQTKAILEAAVELDREKKERAKVKIMLPLISSVEEFKILRKVIESAAEETFKELGAKVEYQVGTMIETPRAAVTAGEIAKYSDFFSFGTNDLTQTTFGFSRDDVEAKFIPKYLEAGIFARSPFDSVDTVGVGRLVKLAVLEGRKTNPGLEVGICGEHGGDPTSIAFFDEAGLDYVSCSAFRVPVARLAAAHATLSEKTKAVTA
ncbi:MAG: pyruvate, phosphate dikinase [Nitrososphaerota archaeon]|nr:pyruvate, phosphate dikinase [Nitrososphaerota archaeon]MDG7025460.1 pyruvate, phosphate dikinase [Nitrososphaerota archaeon]